MTFMTQKENLLDTFHVITLNVDLVCKFTIEDLEYKYIARHIDNFYHHVRFKTSLKLVISA